MSRPTERAGGGVGKAWPRSSEPIAGSALGALQTRAVQWAPLAGAIERLYLVSVSRTIAAGTSEIQRNSIAEHGLGLPRSAQTLEGTCMSIIRLYTGSDGQTHIEELDPASHPQLTSPHPTTNIVFRT